MSANCVSGLNSSLLLLSSDRDDVKMRDDVGRSCSRCGEAGEVKAWQDGKWSVVAAATNAKRREVRDIMVLL